MQSEFGEIVDIGVGELWITVGHVLVVIECVVNMNRREDIHHRASAVFRRIV